MDPQISFRSAAEPASAQDQGAGRFGVARAVLVSILVFRASLDNVLSEFDVSLLGLPIGAVLNVAVIACVAVIIGTRQGTTPIRIGPFWPALLALCAVATLYSPVPANAVRFLAVLATYLALFAVPQALVSHERDVPPFLKVILASALIPFLFGYLGWGADRVASTFTHPNIFAFYICVVLFAVLFVLTAPLYELNAVEWVLLGLIGLAGAGLLLSTQTRGAWLALAASTAIYALLYERRLLWGALIMPLLLLVPSVQQRLSDLGEETQYIGNGMIANSYEWRVMLWESALSWFWQSPITGFGLVSFPVYSPQFFAWEAEGFNSHNVYIQLLFETGFLGAILFTFIFAEITWKAYRSRRGKPMAFAFTVMICAYYMLICYSDNILYYLSFNWYYWLLLGTLRAWLALPPEDEIEGSASQHFGDGIPPMRSHSSTSGIG